jgi:hypothetical protein
MTMQTLSRVSCLGFALLLTACGGSDDGIAETVKLRTNRPQTADGGRLTLTMTKFIDSRCPQTVTCITAGSSVIDVTLAEQGAAPMNLQMTLTGTGTGQLPTYTYGPYRIEYTDMQPYPNSPVLTITDSEATLVVRRD